jgi:hypothetical protein
MKIRVGFVSNSSSSSFIVRRYDYMDSSKQITKRQERLLEKYGFRKTTAQTATDVPNLWDEKEWKQEERKIRKIKDDDVFGYNYGYEVTCNQDYVIEYLVKKKISFVASCHYGHETVLYEAKTDILKIGINYGEQLSMYGDISKLELSRTTPITSITGVKWLNENK